MKKISLNGLINFILFLYILSLYLLTYREGLNNIGNAVAFLLITIIWLNFLLTKKRLVFNKFLLIYLLFIAICATSVFYALDQGIVITKVKTLILIFLTMLSLVNYINTFDKLRNVVIYFVYSGFIASIYIIINSDFYQITRFGSELGNVNAMGMIIGISAVFCLYLILTEKKYLYLPFLLIMIPTILLTGSRKALLFICMSVIIILFLRNRNSIKNKIKFIFATIIIVMISYFLVFNVPLFYEIIGARMENIVSFVSGEPVNERSLGTRFYMTKVGFEMFMDRPLTGYGIDNYRVLYGMLPEGIETYAHNNYIELMVGTGIFGVLIYYLTHIIVLKDLFRASKRNMYKTLCFTFIAIIVSYIILAPTLVYYYGKHFSFLLAIASVVGRVLGQADEKVKTNQ